MKISRNSWHCKLVLVIKRPWEVDRNLCGYFWQVVFGLLAVGFGIFCAAVLFSLMVAPLFVTEVPIAVFSMILWSLFGLGAVAFVRELKGEFDSVLFKDIIPETKFQLPKSSFINVVGAYMKSIKEKVCPIIEFG